MRKKKRSVLCFAAAIATILSCTVVLSLYSVEVSYFFGVRITSNDNHVVDLKPCEKISVAMVVCGVSSVHLAVTLIKSILIQTQNPIDFHFITNDESEPIMEKLISTWLLPAVTFKLHNMESFSNRVDWIPNKHYSGRYGLVKLLLPDILDTVNEVILMDIDTLLLCDIRLLWNEFHKMKNGQLFAMSENLSQWYVTQSPTMKTWPALGRGFNSGVALLNLKELRLAGWNELWRTEASDHLRFTSGTLLADQDIMNAFISSHRSSIHILPCGFNYQLGLHSDQSLCPTEDHNIRILHWNSQNKSSPTRFDEIRRKFENMDMYLFELSRAKCSHQKFTVATHQAIDECDEFTRASKTIYATHLNLLGYKMKNPSGITLVSQLSIDRLSMLSSMLKSWPFDVSIALYGNHEDMRTAMEFISDVFPNRTNIGLHAVYKRGMMYPINYLRNTALKFVQTERVFIADIDFIIGADISSIDIPTKSVLVVPAFESTQLRYTEINEIYTKEKLKLQWMKETIRMFRGDVWPQGHMATDYQQWWNASDPYEITWQMNYEPYVIGRTSEMLEFDNRFIGFGWNKVSHSMLLHRKGFRFLVHPIMLMIHQSHEPSTDITKYRSSKRYRKCMLRIKSKFVRDIYST